MRLRLLAMLVLALACVPAGALPLWELTNTRSHIMVLGSIHFLRATDYPLDPAIDAAVRGADIILMELDMDDLDPAASARTIATLAVDPGGRDLAQLLGPEAWRHASAEAGKLGLDLKPLLPYEPWYAAVVVTQLRLAQVGLDASLGVEATVVADARRDGREIRGLETLEEQLGALDGLSPAAQRVFLEETIDEAASVKDTAGSMIAAWKAGDAKALDADLLDGVRKQPEVYRALIVRRNGTFARKIADLRNDQRNYLVVVGALHLVGPDSVLKLLARDGIDAVQVKAP